MPETTLSEARLDESVWSERRSMTAILGVDDGDSAVAALHASGFRPSTVALLELLPLVELAWADGSISPRERRVLVSAAARRPEVRGSAHTQLSEWLSERPSDEIFQTCRHALRELLARVDRRVAERKRSTLLAEGTLVFSDEGGLLGGDTPLTAEQQRLLAELAADLGPNPIGSPA
jgi:hypothetical protein